MRHALFALLAVSMLTIATGCNTDPSCRRRVGPEYGAATCRCGRPDCPICGRGGGGQPAGESGPPTAQITYPYYTLHGPRDFLMRDTPSLGP